MSQLKAPIGGAAIFLSLGTAFSVRCDYRGKGIGWTALDFLASEAQARGVRRVISIESRENHAAIELEREKGFASEPMEGDPTLIILSKTYR